MLVRPKNRNSRADRHPYEISPSEELVATRYNSTAFNAVYSSVLGATRAFVEEMFPPDFFKSYHIGNSVYSVSNSMKGNDDDARLTQARPVLGITMNFDPMDDKSFQGDPHMFGNLFVHKGAWAHNLTYRKIAWDLNNGMYISSSESREKNSFEIAITLNSEMQALNVRHFVRSRFGLNRPFFLNKRWLDAALPTSLIASIAAAKGVDLSDVDARDNFNQWLNEASDGHITWRKHSSSGKFLYFFKYQVNFLMKITNFDSTNKELVEKSELKSLVKFTLEVEYNAHLNFIAETYNVMPPPDGVYNEVLLDDNGLGVILHSALQMPVSLQLPTGEKCVYSTNVITEVENEVDTTFFGSDLPKDVRKYIDHLIEKDPTYELVTSKVIPKLYIRAIDIPLGDSFEIDWENFSMTVLYPQSEKSHRFLLYVNVLEMNEFLGYLDKPENI